MSTEECRTDDECCYQDDSGAHTLMHACVGLAAALILSVLALFWVILAWKFFGKAAKERPDGGQKPAAAGGGGIKLENEEGASEGTDSNNRSPGYEAPELKKSVSNLSLGSLRSLDNIEMAPKWCAEPPSPASTVALEDVHRLRLLLDNERSRRMAAENVLGRRAGTPTSLGTPRARVSLRKFPSPRAIEGHALEANANAARWVQSATTRAASVTEPDLPFLMKCILIQLFASCRKEIRKRLDVRVDGLRKFVGGSEVVQLGGGVTGMAGDTQELLYSELRKRFQSIAFVGRQNLVSLSAGVLSRALKTEEQKNFGRMVVHQTWPSFEPLVRSYLALFVECQLQQPEIEFEDLIGKEETFDPEKHRALGRFTEPGESDENSTCCIVFPCIVSTLKARMPTVETATSGVIVWGKKYTKA